MKRSINKVKEIMDKPFPFYETYNQKIGVPIVMSFVVMIGIVSLNPSKNLSALTEQIINLLLYGFVTIIVTLVFSLLLPEIFPKIFSVEKWTVKKTIFFFLTSIFSVGLSLSLIAYYFDNPNDLLFSHFFYLILMRAIALSFFPIIILVLLAERALNRKTHKQVIDIENELKIKQKKRIKENELSFTFAKNSNDEIYLLENHIFYIKAEGNYCLFVFMEKGTLKKQLIRSKLKEVEQIIEESKSLTRCHRSYIVNLKKISNVTGNAKGYLLHLNKYNFKVPVSRQLSKTLIDNIRHNL